MATEITAKLVKKETDYFESPNISNSDLSLFEKSPKLFNKVKNQKELKTTESKSLRLGTMIHKYLLENGSFYSDYIVIPTDMETPRSSNEEVFCNIMINSTAIKSHKEAYIEAYACEGKSDNAILTLAHEKWNKLFKYINFSKQSTGRIQITEEELKLVKEMSMNVASNPTAAKLLFNNTGFEIYSEIELTKHKILDIPVKGKLDRVKVKISDSNVYVQIIDFKSTSSNPYSEIIKDFGNPYENIYKGFLESFIKYDYLRQLAFYRELVLSYLKEKHPDKVHTIDVFCIASSTLGTKECMVYNVSDNLLDYGKAKFMRLLEEYKMQLEAKEWRYPLKYKDGLHKI